MENSVPSLHVKIVIAEHLLFVRKDLGVIIRTEPGFEIVGEAVTRVEALQLLAQHHPDIIILNPLLPTLNGIEMIDAIKNVGFPVRVVVISPHDTKKFPQLFLETGIIDGYWDEFDEPGEIIKIILAIRSKLENGPMKIPCR
jgi:DNA-binding NarL/FixJ family response regulator